MLRSDMRFRKANPVSLGTILGPVIEKLGCEQEIRLDMLRTHWDAIVGETNARNAKPSSLQEGILTVTVTSPVWMTQARFMKTQFKEKINRHLAGSGRAGINDITFTLEKRTQE